MTMNTEQNPATNSCSQCKHELTCGYSMLAMTGSREDGSYTPCCLGNMSDGEPFFKPVGSVANETCNAGA